MATNSGAKKVVPKVIKIDKALKTAEIWVKNMSGGTVPELTEMEIEGRPARLGLGARINPNVKTTPSTDPVERKLLSKVNAKRKQNLENEENLNSTDKNELESEEDTDEPESRTSAFAKKKPMPLSSNFAKKRK